MIKVLVADDEEKVCQLICSLVDWASFDMQIIGTAANGVEALEKVRALSPDLMITDIRMPGYDGLELISRAKAENEALEFVIISGYRHFDYAQTAIKYGVGDYLLKPIKRTELSATLEKMRQRYLRRTEQMSTEERLRIRLQSDIDKLRSGLFTDLLLADAPAQRSLAEINNDYHYTMQPGLFEVFLIKLDCEFSAFSTGALGLLEEKTSALFRKAVGGLCFDCEICFQGSRAYGVLNFAPAQRAELRRAMKTLLADLSIQNSFLEGASITIGLGDPVAETTALPGSFASAERAVAQRLIAGCGALLEPPAPGEDTAVRALLADLDRTMEAALEVLDSAALHSALERFRGEVLGGGLSGEQIFHTACTAYSLYLHRLDRLGLALTETFTEDEFAARADLCGSGAGLFRLLGESISASLEAISAERRAADTRPIRAAKQYILEHFAEPLTLEETAGIAGFNPSYFSSLFKKECGQNFTEYLAEVRMNKAKELLRESSLSVAEICEAVGYLDLKYFTKTFKKATGIKPGEFRKLYA